MFQFIEFLRALATALVLNSHMKGVYPSDVVSFGGGFGLALFYMISGYLLANIKISTKFPKWYLKKVTRLYIPLLIVRILEIIVGYLSYTSINGVFRGLVFPGTWFGASLLILYPCYYLIVKFGYLKKGTRIIWSTLFINMLIFTALYISKVKIGIFSIQTLSFAEEFSVETPYLISFCVWFSSMLIGFLIRKRKYVVRSDKAKICCFLLSVVCLGIFMAVRVVDSIDLQFLLPLSYLGFSYGQFDLLMSLDENIVKISDKNLIKKLFFTVSKCSLEIFYIQFMWIDWLKNIAFPLNWLLIVACTIISGFAVNLVSTYLQKCLWGK